LIIVVVVEFYLALRDAHICAPCLITLNRQCSLGGIWPPNVCHFCLSAVLAVAPDGWEYG
jgi:hypothetical protein